MGMLERLSDARGTLEGKIVAVVLAILLVLPVATVTAFAGDHDGEQADAGSESTQAVETVIEEVPDQGATSVTKTEGTQTPAPEASVPETSTTPEVATPEETPETPVVEEEALDAVLALNLDEGATVLYNGNTYDVYSDEMKVPADQEVKFVAKAQLGFALVDEAPAVLVAFDGTETDLDLDASGAYTVTPEQVAQELVLQVHAVKAETPEGVDPSDEPTVEQPDAVVEETQTEAALLNIEQPYNVTDENVVEVPSITFQAWCTSLRLDGDTILDVNAVNSQYPGLLESEGLNPAAFVRATATKNGGNYVYSHTQMFATNYGKQEPQLSDDAYTNQTVNDNCNMYDLSKAVSALRFNVQSNQWEALRNGNWSSVDGSRMQLVAYYRAKQTISGDDNEAVYSKDWPFSMETYEDNEGSRTDTACVIYQYYDADGNKIDAKRLYTFFYSNSKDKSNVTVSPSLGYEVDQIKLVQLKDDEKTCVNHFKGGSCNGSHAGHDTDKANLDRSNAPILKKYELPDTFDGFNQHVASQESVANPFTIPWETKWNNQNHACVVAVKLKDATAENYLFVNYLDKDDKPIEGIAPVEKQSAVLKGTTDKPTWLSFLDQNGTTSKVSAKSGYVGQGSVLVPKNAEQEMVSVPLELAKAGYAKEHFKAEITGESSNVLNLYFYRVSNVAYEWEDLPEGAVLSQDNPVVKPAGVEGLAEGFKHNVDKTYQNGTLAYEMSNGKVTNVYRFNGWHNGNELLRPDAEITLAGEDITLSGRWEKLTFSATVAGVPKPYDGQPATVNVNTGDKTLEGVPEYSYRIVTKNEDGSVTYGDPVSFNPANDEGPTDAGTYVVTVKWAATTDSHPEVTAQSSSFVITPRTITITSAGGEKLYDGQPFTKNNPATDLTIGAEGDDGFAPNESFTYNITGTVTNPGESADNKFEVMEGPNTRLENYAINKVYGTLIVNNRPDNNRLAVTLTPRSLTVPYTGAKVELSGIAQINGVPTTNDEFVMNGVTYKVSGYNSGVEETNAGTYNNNISPNGHYVITQDAMDVSSQFSVNVASAGRLTITPRKITLSSEDGAKVYNGQPLKKPGVTVASAEQNVPEGIIAADELFKQEYQAEAEGSVTNVYDENNGIEGNNVIAKNALTSDKPLELLATNYRINEQPGTLTVTARNIDPAKNDDVVDSADSDSGYYQMTVGDLPDKQYEKKSYEPEQNPEVKNGEEMLTKAADGVEHPDYAQSSTSAIDAGKVTVTITGMGNYTGTVAVAYQITPKPAVIIVKNASKKYGTPDSEVRFDGTVDGVIAGDVFGDVSYYRDRAGLQGEDINDPVDEYKDVLAANVNNLNKNYTYTLTPGTFNITPLNAPTISVSDVSKTYDGQSSSIGATLVGEDANNWELEYSTDDGQTWTKKNPAYTDVKASEDGSRAYDVKVRAVPKGDVSNYSEPPAISSGTITIDPKPVTITVNDATKVAGTDNPEFTGAIEGEVAGHELTGVNYFRKSDSEAVGTYADDLTASFDENGNYKVTVAEGDFTIMPMAVPATPPTPPAPGPFETLVNTVADFLATPIIGPGGIAAAGAADVADENIVDADNPLAQIEDDGTPMGAFDHPICWVHYYILLGIIITAIYGGGVIARRLGYNHTIKKYEDDVTGKGEKSEPLKKPVAKEGMQPTI